MALHGHTCGIEAAVPRSLCWSDELTLERDRMMGQGRGVPRLMERWMRTKLALSIYIYINI